MYDHTEGSLYGETRKFFQPYFFFCESFLACFSFSLAKQLIFFGSGATCNLTKTCRNQMCTQSKQLLKIFDAFSHGKVCLTLRTFLGGVIAASIVVYER